VVDVRNDREIPNEFAIHVVGGWPEVQLSHKGASGQECGPPIRCVYW
jgi:hypothetical protein